MKDPFVILRAELVSAAERAALPARRKWWGWLRRPSRPVGIILAALLITGSAAAAVVSVTESASQPVVGRVPGAIAPASVAGYHYTIGVTPGLGAGTSGWLSWILYSWPGTSGYVGGGAGLFTTPIFGVGSGRVYGGGRGPARFARGDIVTYVLTGPQVFAVRIGSRTIRTVSSRSLPIGDRAAVLFVPVKAPHPHSVLYILPGFRPRPPGKHPPGMKDIRIVTIEPLDRSGQVIATRHRPPAGGLNEGWIYTWVAPDVVTRPWPLVGNGVPYHAPGFHGRTHPGPGVCELAQHGLPALHAQFGHTIAWISPVRDKLGELFMSCLDAGYYLHGWALNVAVLLDGNRPGQVLGPIPGARPVPGQPDMVNLSTDKFPSSLFTPSYGLTAKRVGYAWLVAQGGSGLAQRVQALNSLGISKVDLHDLVYRRAPGCSNWHC
jgi:hypothetical protein